MGKSKRKINRLRRNKLKKLEKKKLRIPTAGPCQVITPKNVYDRKKMPKVDKNDF